VPVRVSWAPTPAFQRKTAPGVSRVPTTPGRRKKVGPSSSEIELWMIFLAPAARRRVALRAPRVSAAPGQIKTVEPMQKT
jgi:hypothetical protein